MNAADRIKELEAKLAQLQVEESNGLDPELLAKAKDRARMSWMDVKFVLEYLGLDETLGHEDVQDIQKQLIDHKYKQLSGANRTALSWGA